VSNSTAGSGILVLTSTFPRWQGDSEPGFVFDLCRELVMAGHHVTVLAPHTKGASYQEEIDGVSVRRFRYAPVSWERLAYRGGIMENLKRFPVLYALLPFFLLAQYVALVRCLRVRRYEAVHAHWLVPQGLLLLAVTGGLIKGNPRLVCTAHGSDVLALQGRHWSWLRRRMAGRCDKVVAVSDALRDSLLADGCPPDKLAVIPMGTDLQHLFVPDGQQRASSELLFVGRLVAGKGVEHLLRALPGILANYPEIRLTIIGEGPERRLLEEIAKSLDVAAHVSFVGAKPHAALAAHYRRATLLVLPSLAEGFGLVVVEAMGCACPVVASALPVLKGLLQDGRAGRLFRPGDVADLKDKICELLASAALRVSLGENGRLAVRERYDWQPVARRYAAVLLP
jgi:glycosyltransferase involved in cell wall biosynthesis